MTSRSIHARLRRLGSQPPSPDRVGSAGPFDRMRELLATPEAIASAASCLFGSGRRRVGPCASRGDPALLPFSQPMSIRGMRDCIVQRGGDLLVERREFAVFARRLVRRMWRRPTLKTERQGTILKNECTKECGGEHTRQDTWPVGKSETRCLRVRQLALVGLPRRRPRRA